MIAIWKRGRIFLSSCQLRCQYNSFVRPEVRAQGKGRRARLRIERDGHETTSSKKAGTR
jgi:hypothetical protein